MKWAQQLSTNSLTNAHLMQIMISFVFFFHQIRNCDLTKIGGLLDSKGYGFATPKGSNLRETLTEEILRLTESQEIRKLQDKWWISDKCTKEDSGMIFLLRVYTYSISLSFTNQKL